MTLIPVHTVQNANLCINIILHYHLLFIYYVYVCDVTCVSVPKGARIDPWFSFSLQLDLHLYVMRNWNWELNSDQLEKQQVCFTAELSPQSQELLPIIRTFWIHG